MRGAGVLTVALIFGVIASIRFRFVNMSTIDLIVTLVLRVGGLGLFLRSLDKAGQAEKSGD